MIHRVPPTAVALIVLLCGAAFAADQEATDVSAVSHRLGRGTNVLGWDPIWQDAANGHFKAEHFKLIREAGFNHVRINLHPLRDGKPDADGKMEPEFFKTLDWAVDNALANHLMVILDYHDDLAISPDPRGKRAAFLATWNAIAEHCKDRPADVLFEILNEPAPKFTHELWNQYYRDALEIIRRSNPTRAVVVGPAMWNGIGGLDKLTLPENDHNLIVTFHYYSPFEFTHQGTSWTDRRDKTGVTWEATAPQREAIVRDFDKARDWSVREHRPLYLGEFGAFDKADIDSRVRYVGFVAREAERHGFSWANWQFTGDFIAFDMKKNQWLEPIRDALIPQGVREDRTATPVH